MNVFINDFTKRFTSENPRLNSELFDAFSPCIIEEENKKLIKEVIEEETRQALSQIISVKALGPDGV